MGYFDDDDEFTYNVVVNHEEQYSIWPVEKAIPAGWKETGFTGKKSACLGHINEVWTDMRPLSLRREMECREQNPEPAQPSTVDLD